jgi:hypothetical protein
MTAEYDFLFQFLKLNDSSTRVNAEVIIFMNGNSKELTPGLMTFLVLLC